MYGYIYNENSFDVIHEIANECINPVIVTDPPFNINYHYNEYKDSKDESVYFSQLAQMFNEYKSVVILYPEMLHRLSLEMNKVPERVVSWVYPSNTKRQHRDIGFYGITPDFDKVRVPYRNPNDKRIKELQKRTGGARSYDWIECNQVKNVSKEKTVHPCQMPIKVMERLIKWLPNDITVIDPFAGSGTTALVCETLGISWRAIEIDSKYCEIIEHRINNLT